MPLNTEAEIKAEAQRIVNTGHNHDGKTFTRLFYSKCEICKPICDAADRLEQIARYITKANWIDPNIQPCETCGKNHQNYECCDACNYDMHRCHFCGDDLGHSQISACYILEEDQFQGDEGELGCPPGCTNPFCSCPGTD